MAAVLVCAVVLFVLQTFAIPRKPYWGFTEVADFILSQPESRGSAILVSSEADGEGLLISEVAMRRPQPDAFILRASKVLSRSDWLGRGYEARFQSAEDLLRYLQEIPVDFVVVQDRPGFTSLLHHRQLTEGLRQHPEQWRAMGEFPRGRSPSVPRARVLVYKRKGAPGQPQQRVRLEMMGILQRILYK